MADNYKKGQEVGEKVKNTWDEIKSTVNDMTDGDPLRLLDVTNDLEYGIANNDEQKWINNTSALINKLESKKDLTTAEAKKLLELYNLLEEGPRLSESERNRDRTLSALESGSNRKNMSLGQKNVENKAWLADKALIFAPSVSDRILGAIGGSIKGAWKVGKPAVKEGVKKGGTKALIKLDVRGGKAPRLEKALDILDKAGIETAPTKAEQKEASKALAKITKAEQKELDKYFDETSLKELRKAMTEEEFEEALKKGEVKKLLEKEKEFVEKSFNESLIDEKEKKQLLKELNDFQSYIDAEDIANGSKYYRGPDEILENKMFKEYEEKAEKIKNNPLVKSMVQETENNWDDTKKLRKAGLAIKPLEQGVNSGVKALDKEKSEKEPKVKTENTKPEITIEDRNVKNFFADLFDVNPNDPNKFDMNLVDNVLFSLVEDGLIDKDIFKRDGATRVRVFRDFGKFASKNLDKTIKVGGKDISYQDYIKKLAD